MEARWSLLEFASARFCPRVLRSPLTDRPPTRLLARGGYYASRGGYYPQQWIEAGVTLCDQHFQGTGSFSTFCWLDFDGIVSRGNLWVCNNMSENVSKTMAHRVPVKQEQSESQHQLVSKCPIKTLKKLGSRFLWLEGRLSRSEPRLKGPLSLSLSLCPLLVLSLGPLLVQAGAGDGAGLAADDLLAPPVLTRQI